VYLIEKLYSIVTISEVINFGSIACLSTTVTVKSAIIISQCGVRNMELRNMSALEFCLSSTQHVNHCVNQSYKLMTAMEWNKNYHFRFKVNREGGI
jgi:hypothetical protein